MCCRSTHQHDLGLVQLLLYLHDGVRLLGVLVLCQVAHQRRLELALLCRAETTLSGS